MSGENTHGEDSVFALHCERYWNAGLPVIPLEPREKGTKMPNWSSFQSKLPNEAERASWKAWHHDGNIGLVLGPQSGLMMIDVDTDDPKVLGILDKVLPPSPWKRIGQKGYVLAYKYDGQTTARLKYKDSEGKDISLVEILSAGTQVVVPPSIHPKTGKPYYASADLVNVLDQMRSLPGNIEQILRDALKEAGYNMGSRGVGAVTDFISSGNRDNTVVSMAGLFARDVLRGKRTLLEAIGQMEAKIAHFVEKVYGDEIDPKKGPQKLIEFLIRDVTSKGEALPKGWDDGVTDEQRSSWGLDAFTTENEIWDVKQIRDYFNAHIEKAGVKDNIDAFTAVVKQALRKVADNVNMDPVDEDQLVTYMASVSGKKMSTAAIRRQLVSLRKGPIAGANHAEIAEAVVKDLVELGGEIRCHNGVLWQWEGSSWKQMDEGKVLKFIIEEYGELKAATRANDHGGILKTIKSLVQAELCQRMVSGINFVNGFLTDDLQMVDHHPDFGMTYTLPYPYLPEQAGACPRWQRMLVDYWGDDPDYMDKVTALGEVLALTLFGKMTEAQMAVCLYGVGHSGKSRIMEIVQALMPLEAQTSLPPTMWGDRFGPAQLVGKLLNFAGELSEHQRIDSAKFKQIVAGEVIDAQEKNKPLFTFRPRAAHWFATNHTPSTRDSSDGFTRRWLFLHFTKTFPKDERRIHDYDKIVISEEREAIAAWAVAHMVRLRTRNFVITDPISSIEIREQLENELNTVRDFLSAYQEQGWMRLGAERHTGASTDQDSCTTFAILWNEYRAYCLSHSVSPVGSKALAKRMQHLQGHFGFKVEKGSGPNGPTPPVYRWLTLAKEKRARVA